MQIKILKLLSGILVPGTGFNAQLQLDERYKGLTMSFTNGDTGVYCEQITGKSKTTFLVPLNNVVNMVFYGEEEHKNA